MNTPNPPAAPPGATTEPGRSGPLDFTALRPVSSLDQLVFHTDDAFHMDAASVRDVQAEHITASFRLHFGANDAYRQYCRRHGVDPSSVTRWEDQLRIPLVTATQFKLRDVLSCEPDDIVKICTSSSTEGTMSRVHRDETTLSRFLGGVRTAIEGLTDVLDCRCLHLGPSSEQARDLWIAYAMSIVDLMHPTENFVVDDVFHADQAIEQLSALAGDDTPVMVLGPPIMVVRLMEAMHAADITINGCENVLVVTAGGWKRFSGKGIARSELEQLVAGRLQGIRRESFRDCFSMVELNGLLAECECHVKHAPPWLRLLVLKPDSLLPARDGELGLLAFLDPTPTSYPGFVLTDDLATMREAHRCACGRFGETVDILRRVHRVEARGCALKIDRAYGAQSGSQRADRWTSAQTS